MNKYIADVIAKFLWDQLDLSPDETIGHDHHDQDSFAIAILSVARNAQGR